MDKRSIKTIIFGDEQPTTSKEAKKRLKLFRDFNAPSQQVFESQVEFAGDVAGENKGHDDFLTKMFDKMCSLEARLTKIEENIISKTDVLAHHKATREIKVLAKHMSRILCKISGETGEDLHTEIEALLPLSSIDAIFDIEERLRDKTFEDAVASFLYLLKGANANLAEVIKRIFTDDALSYFNWDGRSNKKALNKLCLVDKVLYDIFKLEGRINFEKAVKKAVEMSHNRAKQKKYVNKLNTTI